MLKALSARVAQKHRTIAWPAREPVLPDRFRGRPLFNPAGCPAGCRRCLDACPVDALSNEGGLRVDLGRCLFCTACREACPAGAISHARDYRLAARKRSELVVGPGSLPPARALAHEMRRVFGRSLKLRQVSAAGCNACESDLNVLGTVVFDLGRFGIQFVASPRHADGIVVTGPVSQNMRLALEKTRAAVPSPKLVIAVGACAISGGPFRDHPEVCNGVEPLLPVDLFIPGCPPHPMTALHGLVALLGRL